MKSTGRNELRWSVVILAVVSLGFFLFQKAGGRVPATSMVVMTYNIGDINGHLVALERVANVIKMRGVPDLLLLQEVHGEGEASALAGKLGLGYYLYSHYQGKKFGLALISRKPLSKAEILYFKESQRGYAALAAELMVEGRRILVCSLHLDRIDPVQITENMAVVSWETALGLLKTELTEETIRSRSVDQLLPWIAARQSDRIIIGGDFNTIPFSKTIRAMSKAYDDVLWPSFSYLNGTYKKLSLPVSPRIDFVFHSPDLECKSASVIREGAGDHYPVRAVFDLE